jgi:hypothetical protein
MLRLEEARNLLFVSLAIGPYRKLPRNLRRRFRIGRIRRGGWSLCSDIFRLDA